MYVEAFKDSDAMMAKALRIFPRKDVRFLFGKYDVCNCNTFNYTNTPSEAVCYPVNASCLPNAFGGTFNGTTTWMAVCGCV